ncbi:MAG: tRNA pseudouridine(38-40) synthase TruA [Candidatus Jidaibacter sp.]|jgi:tRNA pseudouridine38-40 synthase|nr:tRNA pseudouridine(38-40) synthase TruA [Candidatus Jidaibacter sp.]
MSKRYKLVVEYDGAPFAGWQRQEHGLGVQAVVEGALEIITKSPIRIYAAGRTDAGVHATHQVIHFETDAELKLESLPTSLNFFMRPHPVAIVSAEEVDSAFHARFSAIYRSYVYKILNRRNPSVLLANRAWHVMRELNVETMHEAAQILVGKHDFSSFRSSRCQSASPVKTITSIDVVKSGEIIEIHITAPSFLHNQVRIITGALKKVGDGSWDAERLADVLVAKDRTKSAPTAPACGLYLCWVGY